jgi:hypothetical protein
MAYSAKRRVSGAEGDLMELNRWPTPQMLRRYGASARGTRARRSYDRILDPHHLTRETAHTIKLDSAWLVS